MTTTRRREPAKLRAQIDETGKIFEKFGLAPMNGRVLALFTVSESSELTFDEIVAFFGASKSVISTSLSFLLGTKLIDYKTFNTGRKRYFYLTDRFFVVYFNNVISSMTDLRETLYKTISERSPKTPDVNTRMIRWIETANVFEKHLQAAKDQIKKDF